MDHPYITAKNLPQKVLPIVNYIKKFQPDYVICCDRSARIIGYSIFKTYNKLFGSFPTSDHTMKFRKISKKDDPKSLREYLEPTIKEILKTSKKPKVLMVDDWIRSGKTHKNVEKMFNDIGGNSIDLRYATLLAKPGEKRIHVYGEECDEKYFVKTSKFRNNPNILGVDYNGFEPILIRNNEMKKYRHKIKKSIEDLFS